MGKRIFLSLLICLICNVCYIYQVNADASSCTADTGAENCKCPGWGFGGQTGCKECSPGTYNDGTTGDVTQCKPCDNAPTGAGYTESEGLTTNNCPWKLTCEENYYYDSTAKKCEVCPEHYEYTGPTTVTFDGNETTVDGAEKLEACTPITYTITYTGNNSTEQDSYQYSESKYTLWSADDNNNSTFCGKGKYIKNWEYGGRSYTPGNAIQITQNTTFSAKCERTKISCNEREYLPAGKIQCESCPAGSYCDGFSGSYSNDKDQGIKSCPTGSTSKDSAKSITECYMTQGTVRFCDSNDNCIDFNTVFPNTGKIKYDKD